MKNEYVWASSDRERHRLASQGDALRSPTERLFQSAGIGAGMSVLDCGSGAGEVAIIVSELVTSSGQVLGIDRDANNVEAANRRVIEAGLSHVRFETADISCPPDGPYDAIVGRLVLMYQPDVQAVLRALADRLAHGGVMAFLEYEHVPSAEVLMWPRSPSVDKLMGWTATAFDVLGNQERMGTRLPSLLRSAGMEPQPPYELTGAVYTGVAVVEHVTNLLRGLLPILMAHGIATEEEAAVDAFAESVSADLNSDAVMVGAGPALAVWARKS